MAFQIDIGFTSLAGTRPVNEDFAAAMLPEPGREGLGAIAAIADGVSRGGMGREAAQTTVTSLVRDYFATPETWETTVALDRIICAQNSWLAGVNRRRAPECGLTTLTALVLRGHGYSLAHVGDTRAYLLRGGELSQLTHDHAMDHPDMHHKLLRAVGAEERLVVDYSQGDLQVGDCFVLVSDGVHGVLAAKELRSASAQDAQAAQAISESLVQNALTRGGNDNATALVVRVLGVDEAGLQDENRNAQQLPVPAKLKVGDTIDGLTVTALIADTGVNLLYQVRDARTRKLYALKTLHPQRAHDAEERAMLAHEAWLAKRMRTSRAADHLVGVHDVDSPTAFYLLYDWHAGETLQQMIERKHRFTARQAVQAATQAARTLGRLHQQGVIHRDVKPANLHQGEDGVLRLLDLGVALTGREPAAMRLLHAGTPSFINPEQWNGEPPDAQSDLFALGVTLYQLLTGGKLPYGEVLPYQAGRYWRDPVAPSRHNPEVPIWLDHIVLKAVSRDRKLRFETAEELLLALERGASRPITAPAATPLMQRDPTVIWKIALVASVVLNLLLVYWILFLPK